MKGKREGLGFGSILLTVLSWAVSMSSVEDEEGTPQEAE